MTDLNLRQELRKKRIRLGIILYEVARFLNIGESSLSQWENGVLDLASKPQLYERYKNFLQDCENGQISFRKSVFAGRTSGRASSRISKKQDNAQLLIPSMEANSEFQTQISDNIEKVISFINLSNQVNERASIDCLHVALHYLEKEIEKRKKGDFHGNKN